MAPPTYDRREVFAAAPLQLVAAEIRYSFAPRLRRPQTLDDLQIRLESIFPVRRAMSSFALELTPEGPRNAQTQEVFRLFDLESRSSVTVTPEATTIETTDYESYEDFEEIVSSVVAAVQAATPLTPVERVGLRYIDEVRLPDGVIAKPSDWAGWVADSLTAPTQGVKLDLQSYQGFLEAALGDGARIVLRYGALTGPGVVGNDPLRRRSVPEPGPFFLLDTDCFWESPSPEQAAPFDVEKVVSRLSSLHDPTGELFQSSITDELRTVFRGEGIR